MFLGIFRVPSLPCSSSRKYLPSIASCLRSCSSVCVPAAEKTKDSVFDLALNSVVKVFCESTKSSVLQPWQKRLPQQKSGSGFAISRNKILTNAHVVADHTYVQVRKHGSPTKYKAKVEAVGHDCDLAILKINCKNFWEDMKPLDLGDVPSLYETVFVVGYPGGGDNISITKGIVSRVEVTKYSHSKAKLMTIQIDAAINSGNSGGPVFMENKVVGVAFQGLSSLENTGYIIPTPIVKHFITRVKENGGFNGFCSLGIWCQHMENALIRNYFKMTTEMTGVLIKRINPLSSSYNILKKDDVLLSVDGVPIGNDETVSFRKNERINFNHLVSMKKPGETISLKVLREGKHHELNIITKPVQPLIPAYEYDKQTSYYIHAAYVFLHLTKPYIDASGIEDSVLQNMPKKADGQIVVISQVLKDDISVGFTIFEDLQVKKVNGVRVENLKHLRQLIEECPTENLRLDLENDNTIIITSHESAKNITPKILKRYGIPTAMSKDLQSKPTKK